MRTDRLMIHLVDFEETFRDEKPSDEKTGIENCLAQAWKPFEMEQNQQAVEIDQG